VLLCSLCRPNGGGALYQTEAVSLPFTGDAVEAFMLVTCAGDAGPMGWRWWSHALAMLVPWAGPGLTSSSAKILQEFADLTGRGTQWSSSTPNHSSSTPNHSSSCRTRRPPRVLGLRSTKGSGPRAACAACAAARAPTPTNTARGPRGALAAPRVTAPRRRRQGGREASGGT
jgi:hypothetical protein